MLIMMMISGFLVRLACPHSEFEKMFINCVNCGRTLDAPLSALAGFTVSVASRYRIHTHSRLTSRTIGIHDQSVLHDV
jgi:hypothetical protein